MGWALGLVLRPTNGLRALAGAQRAQNNIPVENRPKTFGMNSLPSTKGQCRDDNYKLYTQVLSPHLLPCPMYPIHIRQLSLSAFFVITLLPNFAFFVNFRLPTVQVCIDHRHE